MPRGNAFITPILLVIFNRPATLQAVFASIRSIRPTALYVAADGPRLDVEGERQRCEEARRIATAVDWECEVHTLFRDTNLGAGPAVASAVSWFFGLVEEGIILEDDCVPGLSFYRFCQDLLAHYRDIWKVMHISGHNFQYGRTRGTASYYFSTWTHSGAWASWRRAWKYYDFTLAPESERPHVWDGQWMLSVARQKGVSVIPNLNLVTNVGYGADATHTRALHRSGFLPVKEIEFPLKHPTSIKVNRAADALTYYANIADIPDLRLVTLYQFRDWLALIPARARKLFRRLRRLL